MSISINWKALTEPSLMLSLVKLANELLAEALPMPPISDARLLSLAWPDPIHHAPTVELLDVTDPHPLFALAPPSGKSHARPGPGPDRGSSPFEWTWSPLPGFHRSEGGGGGPDDAQIELKFDYCGPIMIDLAIEFVSPAVLPSLPAGLCSLPTRISVSHLSMSCVLLLAYTHASSSWFGAVKADSDFYFQIKASSQIGGTLELGPKMEQLLNEGIAKLVRDQLTFPNYCQLRCESLEQQDHGHCS